MHSRVATTLVVLLTGTPLGCREERFTVVSIFGAGIGWQVEIEQDGSGHYGYGSGAHHFAPLPADTYDFKKVVQTLKPTLVEHPDATHRYRVSLRGANDVSEGGWTDDEKTVKALFETARRTAPLPETLRKIWEENPPAGATW